MTKCFGVFYVCGKRFRGRTRGTRVVAVYSALALTTALSKGLSWKTLTKIWIIWWQSQGTLAIFINELNGENPGQFCVICFRRFRRFLKVNLSKDYSNYLKAWYPMRFAISPRERLFTLQFLATGQQVWCLSVQLIKQHTNSPVLWFNQICLCSLFLPSDYLTLSESKPPGSLCAAVGAKAEWTAAIIQDKSAILNYLFYSTTHALHIQKALVKLLRYQLSFSRT